jgi:hypothetical protein
MVCASGARQMSAAQVKRKNGIAGSEGSVGHPLGDRGGDRTASRLRAASAGNLALFACGPNTSSARSACGSGHAELRRTYASRIVGE